MPLAQSLIICWLTFLQYLSTEPSPCVGGDFFWVPREQTNLSGAQNLLVTALLRNPPSSSPTSGMRADAPGRPPWRGFLQGSPTLCTAEHKAKSLHTAGCPSSPMQCSSSCSFPPSPPQSHHPPSYSSLECSPLHRTQSLKTVVLVVQEFELRTL